ncbi:MAG: hypothetical protein MI919_05720, partial [Holophagales bacterium]|nr:hypothetical protein [Holophagales bacterium]
HWHRSSQGSDDYTYNAGLQLAYVLRPSIALRDRFAQGGRMVQLRYALPKSQEALRQPFFDQVDITRQVIQHYEMLANCAEFVPGAEGDACRAKLFELVDELARDNLRAGIICQGDIPSATACDGPQRFMVAALFYHFFHRYLLHWGQDPGADPDGLIERALVGDAVHYYQEGMAKLGDGVTIDVGSDWAALLDCALTGGGTAPGACTWVPIDGTNLLWHNKPHSVALLLLAHDLDPSIGLCAVAKAALDHPSITVGWTGNLMNQAGWWKGTAQMLQGAAFGVGLYESCSDP